MFILMFLLPQRGDILRRLVYEWLRVHIESDGLVIWVFGGKFATACELDLTYFPFDKQTCPFTIENWAYPTKQVSEDYPTKQVSEDYPTHQTGEWRLPYPTKLVSGDYPIPPNRWVKITLPHLTGEWRLPYLPKRWVKITLPPQMTDD